LRRLLRRQGRAAGLAEVARDPVYLAHVHGRVPTGREGSVRTGRQLYCFGGGLRLLFAAQELVEKAHRRLRVLDVILTLTSTEIRFSNHPSALSPLPPLPRRGEGVPIVPFPLPGGRVREGGGAEPSPPAPSPTEGRGGFRFGPLPP